MVSDFKLRRIPAILLAFAMVFGVFTSQVQKAEAHSTLDQYVTEADGYYRIESHKWVGQTFRPAFNKLDGLGAYTGIQPSGPNSCTLTLSLYKNTTPPTKIAEKSQTIYKMESYTIIDIPAVNMVPDARYTLYASATSVYAYWLANMSNIYPRGSAIVDSISDANKDMVFATFGYNDAPPAEPDPVPEVVVDPAPTGGDATTDQSSTAVASTESTPTTSATATSTATTIVAPTDLTAQAATDGTSGAINLAWSSSKTSDITGYKIYRSVSESTGFEVNGTTDKKTLSYKDEKAVANQPYYYAVRAYKDSKESKNSNVVSATITDTVAPSTPQNFKIFSQSEEELVFSWDKNTDTDLANYVLTVAENNSADANSLVTIETISKDADTYTLKLSENSNLTKNKIYKIYLQAKDISNNISEKAETSGEYVTPTTENKTPLWVWVAIAVGVVVIAGAVTTFIILRKRKKGKSVL